MKTNVTDKAGIGILCIILLLSFSACSYTVEKIDYNSPQRAAAIVVSDPQVYARASLINDRRREVEYLQQLLANSSVNSAGQSTVKFSPQIIRDLKTVQALSANLGLSSGTVVNDTSTAADLTQKIEVTKLQAQLALLQKQIEGIQNADVPQVTIPVPDLTSSISNAAQTGASSTLMPDVSDLQNAIKNIQAQLSALTPVNGPSAPGNNYDAFVDPRNDFADRQAYRRDIRAALSEAQLDDVHDRGGNALYRLQFQATVLPPDDTAKQWGAAKLEIRAPLLNRKAIESAYYHWLKYISAKLNTPIQDVSNSAASQNNSHSFDLDGYFSELGPKSLKYFNLVDIFLEKGNYYCLNHQSASYEQLQNARNPTKQSQYKMLGTHAVPQGVISFNECEDYPADGSLQLQLTKTQDPKKFKDILVWDNIYIDKFSEKIEFSPKESTWQWKDLNYYVPESFCEAIVDPSYAANFCADNKFRTSSDFVPAAGGYVPSKDDGIGQESRYSVRSYSVLPTELAQRLGVTTEASQSLQTALSVAVQTSSVFKKLFDGGYLSQSDTRAQALARQPIVVGFTGSEPEQAIKTPTTQTISTKQDARSDFAENGFFGWLFGPEFVVKDSNTLALQHSVRSYGVNADVSFPGWWSYINLDISTAWIGNWQSANIFEQPSKDNNPSVTHKRVDLPISEATYESLTNFIAAQQYGPQNSRLYVNYVTPTLVPTCASSVTFQIYGVNIWRADSIYLGGVKATTINVLPDMNGVAAEFDMSTVYGTLVNIDSTVQPIPLVISSEQGTEAPRFIWVIGKRQTVNGGTTCQSPFLLPTNIDSVPTTIVSYTPTDICSNVKTEVPLVIQGINLPDKNAHVKVHSDQFDSVNWEGDWMRRETDLKLKKGVKLSTGQLPIALTYDDPSSYPDHKGSTSLSLTVKDCAADSKSAAQEKSPASPTAKSPAKATLETTSVSLAKDQKITLKTAVPSSYFSIVISVRLNTKTNDAIWLDSLPAKVSPGDAAEVTGTIDLSNLNAAPGASLDVVVKIQLRPDLEPKPIPAIGTLKVS